MWWLLPLAALALLAPSPAVCEVLTPIGVSREHGSSDVEEPTALPQKNAVERVLLQKNTVEQSKVMRSEPRAKMQVAALADLTPVPEAQPCSWKDWGDWSRCSVTCGQGRWVRSRVWVSNDTCRMTEQMLFQSMQSGNCSANCTSGEESPSSSSDAVKSGPKIHLKPCDNGRTARSTKNSSGKISNQTINDIIDMWMRANDSSSEPSDITDDLTNAPNPASNTSQNMQAKPSGTDIINTSYPRGAYTTTSSNTSHSALKLSDAAGNLTYISSPLSNTSQNTQKSFDTADSLDNVSNPPSNTSQNARAKLSGTDITTTEPSDTTIPPGFPTSAKQLSGTSTGEPSGSVSSQPSPSIGTGGQDEDTMEELSRSMVVGDVFFKIESIADPVLMQIENFILIGLEDMANVTKNCIAVQTSVQSHPHQETHVYTSFSIDLRCANAKNHTKNCIGQEQEITWMVDRSLEYLRDLVVRKLQESYTEINGFDLTGFEVRKVDAATMPFFPVSKEQRESRKQPEVCDTGSS